jgi:hypothetical protein
MLDTLLLIGGLGALVFATFWLILRSSAAKIESQYRILSEKLGLALEVPSPKLGGFVRPEPSAYGQHRGREVSLSVPGKGLQNTRQIETVLKLELRDAALRAQFAPTGLLGSLGQRDSQTKERWRSQDAAFNAAIDVRSDAGPRLDQALSPELRRWLAGNLKKNRARLYIGNGTIAYARLGLVASDAVREHFETALELFCDFAETLEHSNGPKS